MKMLIIVLAALSFTQVTMAKGGGNDPGKLAFKNSQAGFVSESMEHSLRALIRVDSSMSDRVQNASVVTETPDDSVVTIALSDGSALTYTCSRFDHWSKSGTVLKKEVVCRAQ